MERTTFRPSPAAASADAVSAETLRIRRAQEGDRTAFEDLYRDHVERVYALCLRLTGRPDRAEERTQEVFVRAWRKLPLFRGESALSSWLHRLAVNTVFGEQRSRRRREARVAAEDPARLERPGPPPNPGSRLDLERAIATLPPMARAVFVLHDVEGYRHAEIARFTGVAVGTSKAHLHRARKMLREALK